MKRLVILAILATMMAVWAGCAAGDGVAITSTERAERHRRVRELDRRMLNDDWDLLWLNDRPTRFTEWKVE
jgi:hypothetical protein